MQNNKKRILGIIPARGGSKGIPGKNIIDLAGRPLISYTIKTAIESNVFHRIICSTDDEKIAKIAEQYGAEVPFIRPKKLSRDDTPMKAVLRHAVLFVEKQEDKKIDYVFCLQPTNPFRSVEDITRAVAEIPKRNTDSVIGVIRVESDHPILMKKIVNGLLVPFMIPEKEGTPRQKYKPHAYKRSGSVYLTKRDVLIGQDSIWGKRIRPLIVSKESAINIDDQIDLETARAFIKLKN